MKALRNEASLDRAGYNHDGPANAPSGRRKVEQTPHKRGPNGSRTVLRPTTISPQGVQLNLAPGQTFAKNQFVSGIEVTTILDRNCGNQ